MQKKPKQSIIAVEEITTTKEIIEDQSEVPRQTTVTVEESIETKPTKNISTTVEEETVTVEQIPVTKELTEQVIIPKEKPADITVTTKEEIETTEEQFTERPVTKEIETVPEVTTTTTTTIEEVVQEKPNQPTATIEDTTTSEEIIEEQPEVPRQTTSTVEEITTVESTIETKPTKDISTTVEEETVTVEQIPVTKELTEQVTKPKEKPTEITVTTKEETKTVEEQFTEQPVIDQVVTRNIESTPEATTTTIGEVVEEKPKQPSGIIEEITTTEESETSTTKQPTTTIEEITTTEEIIEEQPKVARETTSTVEEMATIESIVETTPTKDISSTVEEETLTEEEIPVAKELSEQLTKPKEKPADVTVTTKKEIETVEEQFTEQPVAKKIETQPEVTTSTTAIVEVAQEKPKQPTATMEDIMTNEEIITEQPKITRETSSTVEEVTRIESTVETKPTKEISSGVEEDIVTEEVTKLGDKPEMVPAMAKEQSEIVEEQLNDQLIVEQVVTKEMQSKPDISTTTTTTKEVFQEKPKQSIVAVKEIASTEEIIEDQSEVPRETTLTVEETMETKRAKEISRTVEEDTLTEEEVPVTKELPDQITKPEEKPAEITMTTLKDTETVEEQFTEQPVVEEFVTKYIETTPEVTTTTTIIEEIVQEKPKLKSEIIEESTTTEEYETSTTKQPTTTIEEITTKEEIIEEQPKVARETTSTVEKVTETKPIQEVTTTIVGESIVEELTPLTMNEQIETATQPIVESTKITPVVEETVTTTLTDLAQEQPETLAEVTSMVVSVEEQKVPVKDQPKLETDTSSSTEEIISTESKTVEEKIVSEVPVSTLEEEEVETIDEQSKPAEKSTVKKTITEEEIVKNETIPIVEEITTIQDVVEDKQKPSTVIIEEITTTEDISRKDIGPGEEQSKHSFTTTTRTTTTNIEEVVKHDVTQIPTSIEEETEIVEQTIIEEKPTENKPISRVEETTETVTEEIIEDQPTETTTVETIVVEEQFVPKEEEKSIVQKEIISIEQDQQPKPSEVPVHRVDENSNVILTVDTPVGKNIVILKDGIHVTESDHIHIKPLSSTTTQIEIIKAKPQDEGEYTIVVDEQEQPLINLEVTPKPVVRQEMQLPKTKFNEKETLTIVCQFDAAPEEAFIFLHNDQPIVPDSRVTTTIEDNKYTIVVKDLRPEEDEGVYTLKSDHLILDTPAISVVPEEKKPEETEITTVQQEKEIITVTSEEQQQPQPEVVKTSTTDVEMPVHEVEETSTVTLTIEKPQGTTTKDVVLLKNGQELKPSDHVKVTSTSPTTTEVQIVKVNREDEGDYTVEVKGVEQPLVRLKVHPKPVIRQEMELPKTKFNEKETLTIVCQFDAVPEEAFIFLHNDQPIVPDSRVTTTEEGKLFTIVVKDLRPEDEGVYTLKSDHLILDTPVIRVAVEEKKPETEMTTVVEEEETITMTPQQQQQPQTVTEEVEKTTEIIEKKQPQEQIESPIQEVEESTTVTMTVELPEGTSHKEIILLKNNEEVKPSEHIKIVQITPTTTEIQIIKATSEDEGTYNVSVDNQQQPLLQLKVIPKAVVRQTMELPQTTFNEGETLTIKCQFDKIPEETFTFLLNEQPLVSNDRITTTVQENTYIIEVKNLKPEEDQGVYTLKSEHLILDTPSITVLRIDRKEKPKETEDIVEETEEETIVVKPVEQSEITEIEIMEKEQEKLPETTVTTTTTTTTTTETSTIETSVAVEKPAPVETATITETVEEQLLEQVKPIEETRIEVVEENVSTEQVPSSQATVTTQEIDETTSIVQEESNEIISKPAATTEVEQPKPVEQEKPKSPQEEQPKPVEKEKPQPAEQEQTKPVEEEKPKAVEQEKPQAVPEEKPQPVKQEQPKPVEEEKPQPVQEEQPKPVEQELAKPVEEEKPQPVEQEQPKPIEEEKPQPVEEEQPKPVEEEQPKQVEQEQPKPVEEEKPKAAEQEKPQAVQEEQTKPVEQELAKPAEEEKPKPTEEEKPQPVVQEQPKPVEEEKPKAAEQEKPQAVQEEQTKPVEQELAKPAEEEKPKPVEQELAKPVEEEKPKQVEQEQPKPVEEEKPQPVEQEQPKPVEEEKPQPVEQEQPKPVEQEKPKPVEEEKPKAAEQEKPQAVQEEQTKPVEQELAKPAEEEKPKSAEEEKPQPVVQEQPKQVEEEKPQPVEEEQPKQVEQEQPKPVEEKQIKLVEEEQSEEVTIKQVEEIVKEETTVEHKETEQLEEKVIEKEEVKEDVQPEVVEEKKVEVIQIEETPAVEEKKEVTTKEVEQEENLELETPIHEVEENSTVTLTVDRPSRDITLLKDNEKINSSEHIKIIQTSPTTTEIQITKAKPQDEGIYSVLIDNKEQPLMELKVIPKPIVRQTMELPQTKFNEGETLTIKCQFDTIPEETFQFLVNEQPLIPDDRISTSVEDTTYTIVVKNLKPEDEGTYTLKSKHLILDTPSITVVSKPKQTEKTEITEIPQTIEEHKVEETITNEEVPQPQQITTTDVKEEIVEETVVVEQPQPTRKEAPEMPVHEVEETSTVTLTIEKPQGTTTKDVVLLKNGQELKPSDHVKVTSTSPTTTEVQIVKVNREDEGDYTVEVKGVEQPLVRLKVHPKPVIRQEMELPKTKFNEKETLTIVCQFDAVPEEAFIFLHNDQPIVPDSRVTTTIEDKKYTIVVKDLRPEEDEGVYTLKSDHLILDTPVISVAPEEKKPKETETVTVEEEEETITVTPQQPETIVQQEEIEKDVVETKQLEQTPEETPVHEVEENSTVTLTIEKPQQTATKDVHLFKDGHEVKPSDHIKLTSTSPTTTEVQIIKAKPQDEGEYSVVIDNKEQPLMKLKVHPKPVIRQEMELPKTKFNEKETLTIVCQFDSVPEEAFIFLHNDQPIVPDSRVTTTIEDKKYTIVVKDLRPEEDEGVYTLKSDHLILDTPSITVVAQPKKPEIETTTVEEETVTIETPKVPIVEEIVEETVIEEVVPAETKVEETVVETKTVEEIPKEEEDKTYRSEIEVPVVKVPEGNTITIRIPDSKTTESNVIKLYIDEKPIKTSIDEDTRITIEKDGQTDNYVVVSDAKPEDVGRYTVEFNGKLQPICMLEVTPVPAKKSEVEIPVKQGVVEEVVEEEEEQQQPIAEIPIHEVIEGDSVNLTIERPKDTDVKQTFLLQNDKKLDNNTRLTIQSATPTTTEITLENVKPTDEGLYSIQFGNQPSQKLMNLKVLPKPIVHDALHLPKDVFEQGETLTIVCEFDKKPDENLVWKLNDVPLHQLKDDRITIETADDGKSYTLTVKNLRPKEDQGIYKLENSHLVLETPFVRVIENVEEEQEETTILVEDEETESFELQRKPKVEEIQEEQPKNITQEIVPEEIVDQSAPVQEEEEQPVTEPVPEKQTEEEKPKPKFVKPLKPNKTTLLEGEQLVIEGELDSIPTNVQLQINGQPIPEDRVKTEVKDKKIKFTLDNIKLDESGDFNVKVNEDVNSPPVSITVNADLPTFVKNLTINKTQVDAGDTLNFECTLNKPFDEIVWLKDGQPIEENAHIQFTKDGPKLKMTIKDAKPEDHTGTYSVRVKNIESDTVTATVTKKVPKFVKDLKPNKTTLLEGEQLTLECELDTVPTKVQLKINGEVMPEDRVKTEVKDKKIKFTLDNIKLDESGDFNVKVNDEIDSKPVSITVNADIPKFVKNLTINKKQFDLGETLNFECTLNKPFDEVVWLKDGQPIEEDAHVQFTKDGPKLKMTIKDAKPEDHTHIFIPKFVKELKANKTTLTEGEQLTLECELDTVPTKVQLKINGEVVPEDRVQTEVKDKKIKFTLDNIKLDESGDFNVKVNDEVDSKPVSITVNADIPKFVKNLTINKKQFDMGETLHFECTLNKPFDEVVWLKDGQPIEEDAHVQFTKDGPKLKLTIKDAKPEDHTGTYSVRVKEVESDKVPVTVTKKVPKFVKDLKANKTTLMEGEQLVLECELDTVPTDLQLVINGQPIPEDRVKTEVKDKKIKFTLDNIKLDESGNYNVKVNNEVDSKPVSITVNADIPRFVKNLTINKKQFDLGETLNFECTLNKPFDEVVWLKDGQPIEENAHVQFTKDGPKLKLTIKDAQPEDHTGTYSVRVKEVESDKVPVTVTKKVPKFVKELKANKTTLTEGEQLILEGELDMTPTNVKLQLNGETIPEDRVKTEIKDKKIKFTLDNIKLDESGDFNVKVNDEVDSKPVSITVNADIPKFVKNLTINKKQFDKGETLNFECTLNKPFDEVVWLKDGQPIEEDAHVQFTKDGPKLKLTIKDAQPEDHTGTYSVRVKEVESDKVPVTVTKKVPKFVKDLKANKTTLTEGEQLVLECELDMAPSDVKLQINGETVPADRVKTEVKDKKIKFTLDNIKLDESGDFTVKVNDEVDSKPVSITVNADIPRFVKNLTINKKQFDLGETLNFECTLNKPFDEVVWLKDGQPIEENAHVQFTKDGPKLKLTIKDAQPEDHTGTYSVRVKEVESDKVPVTVTKKVPKFVKELKANKTTLTEGEQLILECELDMAPTDVKLQVNGETIPEDRVKTEIKDKKIKFTLDNIKLDESGDYTVKVNDEVDSKPVSITVNADIPKFVKNLTINKKQFDKGETLNFECTLNKPFDEVGWLKDGQPIEEDAHVQFTKDGPKLKLTIKDAQPEDHTGTYSVLVKEVESDKVPVTVTKKVPKFVKDLKANKTTLTEGEQLVLECELDMAPETVELKLNGETIPNDRIKPEIRDKKIKFTLDNIQLNESGDYTVKVNNEVDSKSVSITVNADIPKFVKNLTINKKQFEIGETLNFECTLNKPFNDIVWLKNNEPIEEDAHIQFTQDGPKLKLTIKDAQPEDHTGTYSVRVKEVESDKVPVIVQEKPLTFVKDLKAAKTTLDENETLELSCQLSRPLKPNETIQWYRNEVQIPIEQDYPNQQIDLQIPEVQPTMSGEYRLEISSPNQPKPLKSSSIKITIKPEQIKFIKPLYALKNPLNEDETLVLECELDKPTYKSVVFFLNDKPLNENGDDRIKVTQTGNKWQIQIINVKQDLDQGEYTVTINEKVTSPKVKVTIIKTLIFIEDLTVSNSKPITEETITFECELSQPLPSGDSKDLSLTLNGKLLSTDQTKRLKINVNSTSPKITMTLANVKLNVDQGDYQLKVLHPQQIQSQIVHVTVRSKPIEVLQPLQSEKADVYEDDTLVLSTKLKNVPENPTIVWLKDGQPLTIDNKRIRSIPSRDGQQFKLSIENVHLDQSGTYALQINNENLTQCDIQIKSIPLKTVTPLKIIGTPVVNGNVELQIELNRANVPFVWMKDETPLENQPATVKDQTKYRLKLSDLKLEDTGIYSISFNNGELVEQVNLTVALPPFEFIEQLKCIPSDDVEEGSDVLMQCVLNRPIDDETIPITLMKNNKPLTTADSERVKIERDGPTLKIHLTNVKPDDVGTYKVTIDKTKDSSTRLKVHDKPLTIIEQLHLVNALDDNNTVNETSSFDLFIRYNKPVKNLVLNRDNKRLPADKHIQILYEDDSSSVRIRFDAAQPDDKGKYETIVKDSTITDKDGLRSQSVTITIKPLPVLFTSDIEISSADKDNIPEKTEVILTTTINQEKGKIKWFLNDKEIKEDQNHKITIKNLQRQLTIKSTVLTDSGVYSVKSEDDQRTIEITIKDNLRFLKELTPTTVNTIEGTDKELLFECETSKSTPVQWFHDQQKLSPTELKKHYQIESTKTNTIHKLKILQPVISDSGSYRCVLPNNIETSAQCTIEPAGIDFQQQLTTPVHVEHMKSALLECELTRKPQNVIWKDKNGEIIQDNDKYEIMNNGKLQGLVINDCDENDNGSYTITIDNTKSSTAEVIVEPALEKVRSPSPPPPPQAAFRRLLPNELNTTEETDVLLECEVNDTKQITDWYLDDDLIQEKNPHFKIINNGTIRQLKVPKIELKDAGKYTCKDRQTKETTNCNITVYQKH
ncbi:hypothetical protein I4U23_021560 [Adineta vaga]|nr:hypothetical protein I4U23_021560 [Adineta vaga]